MPGRRGAFLILFGLIWAAIGWGVLTVQPSPVQRVGLAPLIGIAGGYQHLAYGWLAAGGLAVVFAFIRRYDRYGFYALMLPVVLYAASYAVTTLTNDITTGIIAAAVYTALAVAVGIVAGWPDPPPNGNGHPHPAEGPNVNLAAAVVILAAAQAISPDQDTIEKVAVALIGLGGIVYTRRSARAADARKVDALAYSRAQEINEQSFERLEREVSLVRKDLADERIAHAVTKELLRVTVEERDTLRDQIRDVYRRVDRLARIIRAADLDLPAEYDERAGGTLDGISPDGPEEPTHQGN